MYVTTLPTTAAAASWRRSVAGASAYAFGTQALDLRTNDHVMAMHATDPKTFVKGIEARPTRRGAPPH